MNPTRSNYTVSRANPPIFSLAYRVFSEANPTPSNYTVSQANPHFSVSFRGLFSEVNPTPSSWNNKCTGQGPGSFMSRARHSENLQKIIRLVCLAFKTQKARALSFVKRCCVSSMQQILTHKSSGLAYLTYSGENIYSSSAEFKLWDKGIWKMANNSIN